MFKPNYLTPEHEEVQQVKKVKPYTITTIKDIDAHRIERIAIEAKWQEGFLQRETVKRQVAFDAVAGQDKSLTFSQAEKQEIAYRKTRDDDYTYAYKPRHTPGKWDKENESEKAFSLGGMILEEPPKKPTLKERLLKVMSNLMKSGFDW